MINAKEMASAIEVNGKEIATATEANGSMACNAAGNNLTSSCENTNKEKDVPSLEMRNTNVPKMEQNGHKELRDKKPAEMEQIVDTRPAVDHMVLKNGPTLTLPRLPSPAASSGSGGVICSYDTPRCLMGQIQDYFAQDLDVDDDGDENNQSTPHCLADKLAYYKQQFQTDLSGVLATSPPGLMNKMSLLDEIAAAAAAQRSALAAMGKCEDETHTSSSEQVETVSSEPREVGGRKYYGSIQRLAEGLSVQDKLNLLKSMMSPFMGQV